MKDKGFILLPILIWAALLFGEFRCIYKMCTCNWEPVGKAEIIYTGSAVTGLGCITGWIDIEDK